MTIDYGKGNNCSVCLTEITFSVNQTAVETMTISKMVVMLVTTMILQTLNRTHLLCSHWIFVGCLMNKN